MVKKTDRKMERTRRHIRVRRKPYKNIIKMLRKE